MAPLFQTRIPVRYEIEDFCLFFLLIVGVVLMLIALLSLFTFAAGLDTETQCIVTRVHLSRAKTHDIYEFDCRDVYHETHHLFWPEPVKVRDIIIYEPDAKDRIKQMAVPISHPEWGTVTVDELQAVPPPKKPAKHKTVAKHKKSR